jgi:cytochrome c oxidase assembly factor CtaG
VAVVVIFVPPLSTSARRYEYDETIQFCLAAFAVPALLVVGRPWGHFGARGRRGRLWRALDGLGQARLRHPELGRALGFLCVDVALVVLWRTPAWMDALARHPGLVALEVASLAVAGLGLWLELLACPPLVPRLPRPWRAVLAALSMWAAWVMAYVVGFSRVSWYPAFHHAGAALSASADQEIATGLLWIAAVGTFAPVVFVDVMAWLKNSEDPDAELRRLVQAERRSGARRPDQRRNTA